MNTDLISRADAEALFRTARSKLNPSDYKTADEFNTRDLMLLNAEQMIHLLPSVTPKLKPCDDAISRQEALDCLNGKIKMSPDMVETFREYLQGVIDAIEGLASVMPEKRAGHWIIISPTDMYCSECNEIEHLDISRRFCAYCGAKMVEPQESEDKE